MLGKVSGSRTVRTAGALVIVAATAVAVNMGTATSANAAKACHYNTAGTTIRGWSEVGTHYPVTLHGTKVHLYTDAGNAAVYAKADSVAAGDILSIDRSNFAVSGTADHYWKQTPWIMAQTPNSGYDYCEWTAGSAGSFSTSKSNPIDGAHRYIRVCLRHAGSLQCAPSGTESWWYGDNDDNWNDTL
ncbi:hypothetical protein [Streptomyces sp. NPDC002265]|uniref:hypothetical protein n=1 Tax=Streptomyces sp. NPDC002265 TaxID=3154415 RepID=UPI003333A6FD